MVVTPFAVVYADPPWKFKDSLPGPKRGAAKHYPTMTPFELKTMDLPPIATDAVLFLWRVASMQTEALAVMTTWGFTCKSELVWRKQTVNGKRWFGMGRIVRMEHEVCLVGTRGRPTKRANNVRSVFDAVNYGHSEKPEAMYAIIESLYPGPYVELFARYARSRPEWAFEGDEK